MNKKVRLYIYAAIVFFAATMFCFGSKYSKPVSSEVTYGIAILGAVFSILTRLAYNKEKENAVKDKL
jgi:hypothetical protein